MPKIGISFGGVVTDSVVAQHRDCCVEQRHKSHKSVRKHCVVYTDIVSFANEWRVNLYISPYNFFQVVACKLSSTTLEG